MGKPVGEGESRLAAILLLLTLAWVFPLGAQLWRKRSFGCEAPKLLFLESCPPSPCGGGFCFSGCQGWDTGKAQPLGAGCEPSFIYLGCWHRAQKREGGEAIDSETVTPNWPSELFFSPFLSVVVYENILCVWSSMVDF